jgi:hypothetical protein
MAGMTFRFSLDKLSLAIQGGGLEFQDEDTMVIFGRNPD